MAARLRVVAWNCRGATKASPLWEHLLEIAPDVALLQDVRAIPSPVLNLYAHHSEHPVRRTGGPQPFSTVVMVRGAVEAGIPMSGASAWVDAELRRFAGNLVARELILAGGCRVKAVSVYSPAWPVDRIRLSGYDVGPVKLKQNPDVWVTDLLLAFLTAHPPRPDEAWLIGGDFNLSETFDVPRSRGNGDWLTKMKSLGLTECLRTTTGVLTPTFRNPRGGAVQHQIDHLFVTQHLAEGLIACRTSSAEVVFERVPMLSDHLPIIAEFDCEARVGSNSISDLSASRQA